MALRTAADVAILGGSAGCGKTFTLLMEPTRHVNNPAFGGVIFRRTTPQIANEGGLWDTSLGLYTTLGGEPMESKYRWKFPSGASLKFSHLEYDKNALDWQGSQIPFIGFDELTHFSEYQFNYMVSRNRSSCGVRPYIRATCNPDPDSWVAQFISWWIDQDTGFPIPERAGKLRYMTRDKDAIVWGSTVDEVISQLPHIFNNEALRSTGVDVRDLVRSVTFIPGSILTDNKIFIAQDPGYLGGLLSLEEAEKAQLLDGNWKVRTDGMGLVDFAAGRNLFSNYPEQLQRPLRCITVDAARFGRDFCVIKVWNGWEVIHISVYKKSDVHDIKDEIERLRRKFNVMRSDVVIDQDGVGGGTVSLGSYTGFSGGAPALKDPDARIKENYFNLKTQCYYRFAERVNRGEVRINVTSETCLVYDDSKLKPNYTTKIKVGGSVRDIKDLITADLQAVKRGKRTMEGKLQINTKDEQKALLGGRSPDFGDTLMMREYLELKPRPKTMAQRN